MREGGKVKSEKLKMKKEEFLEQYLAGKAPLHADRLNLPTEEELDATEAEFDKMVKERKRPARLLSLWPWFGTAVAAMLVVAFLLWPKEQPAIVTEEVSISAQPVRQPAPQSESLPVAQETSKPKESSKPHFSHNSHNSHRANKPQPLCEAPPSESLPEPVLAKAEPEPQLEEEAPVIPPGKQALVDIYLAEEALQVAYKLRAQQEELRAYAASLTGEELPKPIIAF